MNDDTILEVESRQYINPQVGLDERLQFIDTLRDVSAQNTAQINQNTYNLGSQVPSNVGGLTGSEGLWKAQYQTPQLDAQVGNLRAVAQQNALNQAVQNVNDIEANRLKQAWRGYYARKKAQEDADRANRNQLPEGDVKTDPLPELNDATSEWEGPSTTVPGTTTSAEDRDHYWTTDNKYGVTIDNPQGLSVNNIIKQIESQGHRVTNKNLNVDKDGFLTLNILTKDGGTDTLVVNMKSNLTNRGY